MSNKVDELVSKVKKAKAAKKELDSLRDKIKELETLVSEKSFKVIDEQKLSQLLQQALDNSKALKSLDKDADYTDIVKALDAVKTSIEESRVEPVKEVTVSNLGDIPVPKQVEVSNFPEQKEFPEEMGVKILGKPEFSELEPDSVTMSRNRDGHITQIIETYGKTKVRFDYKRDFIGNITSITRTVL